MKYRKSKKKKKKELTGRKRNDILNGHSGKRNEKRAKQKEKKRKKYVDNKK